MVVTVSHISQHIITNNVKVKAISTNKRQHETIKLKSNFKTISRNCRSVCLISMFCQATQLKSLLDLLEVIWLYKQTESLIDVHRWYHFLSAQNRKKRKNRGNCQYYKEHSQIVSVLFVLSGPFMFVKHEQHGSLNWLLAETGPGLRKHWGENSE